MALDLPVDLYKDGVAYARTASTATDYWNLRGAGWAEKGEADAEPVEVEVATDEPAKDPKPVKVKVNPVDSKAGDSTPVKSAGDAG